jgi:hypothetical protein
MKLLLNFELGALYFVLCTLLVGDFAETKVWVTKYKAQSTKYKAHKYLPPVVRRMSWLYGHKRSPAGGADLFVRN